MTPGNPDHTGVEDPATLLQRLGEAMSDLSEQCYYAGWMAGTEYLVPELCRRADATGQPQPWGHGEVTPERARELLAPAARLGSWADLDEAGIGYVPHQPFPLPPPYLEQLEREQNSRKASHESQE